MLLVVVIFLSPILFVNSWKFYAKNRLGMTDKAQNEIKIGE